MSRSFGNKLCLVVSICPYWRGVVDIAKYSKRSSDTQVSYTLKNHHRVFISQCIRMVGRSKWLLFRQVVPSQSLTLLIIAAFGYVTQWLCLSPPEHSTIKSIQSIQFFPIRNKPNFMRSTYLAPRPPTAPSSCSSQRRLFSTSLSPDL